ncbi:MAG: hypothetical protein K9L17_06085 [Clostridiales bacterium]|nr:hypothetical protein [Clostridiales bacterium]
MTVPQIDNPYLDTQTNGLSYAVKYMRSYKYSAHITLKSEDAVRSDLASWAAANLTIQ